MYRGSRDEAAQVDPLDDPRRHTVPDPVVLCYRDRMLRDDVPFDAVDGEVNGGESVVWLDLEHPQPDQLLKLQDELSLHPLVLQDLKLPHQRPKVDEYPGLTMVVLIAARETRRLRLHLSPVSILLGQGYIVTIHRDPIPALETVRERWRANPAIVEPHPHELLLYRICEALTSAYFPLVDTFDARIERIEDRLFRSFDRRMLQELLTLRRDLTELRRVVAPPRDVYTSLARHDDPNVGGFVGPYFTDLVDLILRLTDTIDTMRERLGTALDSYLTLQSNALNESMKRLTAVTVMIMLPTIVSGVYGMNFDVMPELHWDGGYPFALGLMALLVFVAWLVFRRKDWI
ncbi:MAG: magnesium/cobalt transporter CorA [Chloroflexi bacterium]|nr:magnesium/cobalt transporter CorA [Chloroflexota bacterium]